mmetsp:Transcript_28097/g.54761  ORF Transcript_28097/g.54761 Transcript_28097/m.54761 type:complete len:85 (+) Transcript_28097:327-581(+)
MCSPAGARSQHESDILCSSNDASADSAGAQRSPGYGRINGVFYPEKSGSEELTHFFGGSSSPSEERERDEGALVEPVKVPHERF